MSELFVQLPRRIVDECTGLGAAGDEELGGRMIEGLEIDEPGVRVDFRPGSSLARVSGISQTEQTRILELVDADGIAACGQGIRNVRVRVPRRETAHE